MTKQEAAHLSDVLKAYSEGKEIELVFSNSNIVPIEGSTIKVLKQIEGALINGYEVIVKPEPKYRPYANAEEFLKASKEHGPYIINDLKIAIVPEWHNRCNICYGNDIITSDKLLHIWKWQDGTPTGILEE